MDKPRPSIGVAVAGRRRATEFRIVRESIVDFVDRGVREGLHLLFLPLRISVRTGPRLEPVLPSTSPRSISPSNFPPSLMSFVARQALSVVRTQIHSQILEIYHFFLHPFRRGQLPGPRGSCHPPPSSEKVCSSPESAQTHRMLNFADSSRVDFVQDLYLKELKVYKPAPKVPRPAPSPVKPRNSPLTSYLLLGCQ